jgi:hypothetical protein
MATVLNRLPTLLTDEDWLGFAPLEVVTVSDLRKASVTDKVKTAVAIAAVAAAGVVLFRGYQEAKGHLDELDILGDDTQPQPTA